MAFASTIAQKPVAVGNRRMSFGTFDCSSATGGNIDTGLRSCEQIMLQITGTSVAANAAAVNETLPVAGSAVTIVTDASVTGNWIAWGY